tara:strand:- start:6514 stop:10278 length:3765 start_codon:yes stop_codon:yes gene_type:complete
MAHQDHIVDRLSTRLSSLLPDYIKDEAPIFESFLEAYFEYLESEIITLDTIQALEGTKFEDGTQIDGGSLLIEEGTDPTAPDIANAKLLQEGTIDPFQVGEYIYGESNGSIAKIKVINDKTLIVDTISGTGFAIGETIKGRDGNQTATIKTYKENSVVANNRLLDYSDIDSTLETFLEYFQKDFIPSLDLKDTQNKRLTLKNIGSLYKQKGTSESVQFLMRLLFGQNATIKYPIDETTSASDSDWQETRRMNITMTSGLGKPKATDKVVQYNQNDASIIDAEAIIEQVQIIDLNDFRYSISISTTHRGEFQPNRQVSIIDRDGITSYVANVKGIISDILPDESSTSFGLEDDGGELLLEDGSSILFENTSIGSMYNINDVINFTGSKLDTGEVDAKAVVTGLSRGPVEHVYIENAGSGYSAGDIVIFEDENTEGAGAEGIIEAVGDEIILEDSIALDQYTLTATANQTTFGGVDADGNSIRDNGGKPFALNGLDVKVFVNGIEQNRDNYDVRLDRVVFTTTPTPDGGEKVEVFSSFQRILQEDGDAVHLESSDQRIRRVKITNGGSGYQILPRVFPGGYLYFDDVSGYTAGELVTGAGGATGEISKIDNANNRLVIRRLSTHTGTFNTNEVITGSSSSTEKTCTLAKVTSGTGGNLFAWSTKIGGIENIRISSQGYDFDENARVASDSTFNILVTNPSAEADLQKDVVLTGSDSGSTANIVSFDNQRNILKITGLDGFFLPNEKVTYANNQSFRVLQFDPYDARGKFAGEGIINDNFFGEKSYVSNQYANLQDSRYYQSHSYVIRVGESIEKYRSIVKDLVHPAGHLFFGEVAVENIIVSDTKGGRFSRRIDVDGVDNSLALEQRQFLPTLIIQLEETSHLLLEDSTRDNINRFVMEDGFTYVEDDAAFESSASTKKETIVLVHTKKEELDSYNMSHILRDFVQQATNHDRDYLDAGRQTITQIKKFLSSETDTNITNNVSGQVAVNNTHVSFVQKSPRLDGVISVLNIATADNNYLVLDREDALSPIGVRPQDQGKVFTSQNMQEERLMFEDGSLIQAEEPLNRLRHEPERRDFLGEAILLEDNSGNILIEDDTIPEEIDHFLTERSLELVNPYMYMENNSDRIVMEDGSALVSEQNGTGVALHSFVPIGHTFRTINKIAFQNTYRIAYYLLDESDGSSEEDRILLESGTEGGAGHLLLETSVREGMRVNQLDSILGNFYVSSFDTHENRRTNIAFSSYVSSTNITNSTLEGI